MARCGALGLSALGLVALAFPAASAFGQSYGPGDQTETIGAADFQSSGSDCNYLLDGVGYMSGNCVFYAPLHLPEGAHITQMCLYAYDPDAISHVTADIETVFLPAGGQSPGENTIPGSTVDADFNIGYGTVCTDSLDYVVHSTVNFEHQAHRVSVVSFVNSRFSGVRIIWHREVVPLPAVSSFDDVPLGSTYSPFIEALKAAGITGGCQAAPPLYCPDRPITRAEMAVYMALALGLHWPS